MVKVIFIKDLKGQGKNHEIKEVSDGYATNFLIKNGYAVKYTKTSFSRLDNDLDNIKKKDEFNKENARKVKEKLEKESLSFKVQIGKESKVFGSISSKQIYEELLNKGYNVDKKKIIIDNSLNTLGNHYVKIELYKDIVAELNIKLIEK